MTIEVISVPGCPHHATAVERVREALAALGLAAAVEERWARDAAEARAFGLAGSPTIRIGGRNVGGGAPGSLACRWAQPLPSPTALRRAIARAAAARHRGARP